MKQIIFLVMIYLVSGCSKIPDKEKNAETQGKKSVSAKKVEQKKVASKKKKKAKSKKDKTSAKTALLLKLSGSITDSRNSSPFSGKSKVLAHIIRDVNKKIVELKPDVMVVKPENYQAALSTVWELAVTLREIADEKKIRLMIYADHLDGRNYLLASMADHVSLNPAGGFSFTGMSLQSVFIADLLKRFGIRADFLQVGKFKGAAESLTRSSMSPELRESLQKLVDTTFSSLIKFMLLRNKSVSTEKLTEIVDSAPLTAKETLKKGLVSTVGTWENFVETELKGMEIKELKKEKKKQPGIFELLNAKASSNEVKKPHIALLIAEGEIIYGGKKPEDLLSEKKAVASTSMVEAIRKLEKNDYVKAVILRINSPGGSALASEIIWSALDRLNAKKPLIISMGGVAASGGYYIASAGRRIFASPFTITGSIGVVGGKIVFEGAAKELNVTVETVKKGKNSTWTSQYGAFSPSERKAISASMAETYELFKSRILKTRKIKNLEEIAQGRVWSGADALKIGLVDEFGTILHAARYARKLSRLGEKIPVIAYPRPRPWFETFSEIFESASLGINPLDALLPSSMGKSSIALWTSLLKTEKVFVLSPLLEWRF
ncbi:MAG: signal peptide peptidase SppA [Deltaproteobacteria bacterium]|nr:signal peptide peptidase SppA [Deltaproteobacteria bacterium]